MHPPCAALSRWGGGDGQVGPDLTTLPELITMRPQRTQDRDCQTDFPVTHAKLSEHCRRFEGEPLNCSPDTGGLPGNLFSFSLSLIQTKN